MLQKSVLEELAGYGLTANAEERYAGSLLADHSEAVSALLNSKLSEFASIANILLSQLYGWKEEELAGMDMRILALIVLQATLLMGSKHRANLLPGLSRLRIVASQVEFASDYFEETWYSAVTC